VGPTSARAYFRFYAELNDHLPPHQRHQTLEKPFYVAGSVKDAIESFGVPHTEVELIVANGESVPFSYVVRDGDRMAVYPMFESFDVTPELKVRREPLREPRFVLDVHLGRLAAYLRMLGFDAVYANSATDSELVRISSEQQRILLTRDRGLLKPSAVSHGYLVRHTDGCRQIAEVVDRFDLARSIRPFTRCMACNGALARVPKEQVLSLLPSRTAAVYDEFQQCAECGRLYWKGPHYRRMQLLVSELTVPHRRSLREISG
jgi:uncharacterized protein with PIN domain